MAQCTRRGTPQPQDWLLDRSLTSLCRNMGKPPLAQERACSMEELELQEQWVGVFCGCQQLRSAMASQNNAPLCRKRLNSSSGSDVSQLEAPLSCDRSMALCSAAGASSLMDDAEPLLLLSRSRRTVFFAVVCASMQSKGYSNSCSRRVAKRWTWRQCIPG